MFFDSKSALNVRLLSAILQVREAALTFAGIRICLDQMCVEWTFIPEHLFSRATSDFPETERTDDSFSIFTCKSSGFVGYRARLITWLHSVSLFCSNSIGRFCKVASVLKSGSKKSCSKANCIFLSIYLEIFLSHVLCVDPTA